VGEYGGVYISVLICIPKRSSVNTFHQCYIKNGLEGAMFMALFKVPMLTRLKMHIWDSFLS